MSPRWSLWGAVSGALLLGCLNPPLHPDATPARQGIGEVDLSLHPRSPLDIGAFPPWKKVILVYSARPPAARFESSMAREGRGYRSVTYSGQASDTFYRDESPTLGGFTLIRRAVHGPSLELRFKADYSPVEPVFRFVLASISINSTAAPVPPAPGSGAAWLHRAMLVGFAYDALALAGLYQYGDGAIDLRVDIEVEALFTHKDGSTRIGLIAPTRSRTLWGIELGSPTAEECPLTDCSWGWLPLVPVSDAGGRVGHYTIRVTVTEADDLWAD